MMISRPTLREGVSAGLGRDDVRTVTVVPREPCASALWFPIFPPRFLRLETGGRGTVRARVILDGNELICYPGTPNSLWERRSAQWEKSEWRRSTPQR